MYAWASVRSLQGRTCRRRGHTAARPCCDRKHACAGELLRKARYDQFLASELRPMVTDGLGYVLDEATQQPPHLLLQRSAPSSAAILVTPLLDPTFECLHVRKATQQPLHLLLQQ